MDMKLIGPIFLIGGQDFNRVRVDWPANDANVYLVDSGDTFIMVDCGCGDSLPGILDNVRQMDFEVSDISHLLLTHAHFPHATATDAIQKMEIEVLASQQTAEAVEAGDLRTASYCYHHEFPPCEKEITVVEDGESLEVGAMQIRAVALPGHSPGCMGYELGAGDHRILFSGDVVRNPGLKSHRDRFGYDSEQAASSLVRLLEDPPDIIYPGHGPFCLSDAHVWIEEELHKVLTASF
ncbi:MAG: MBL fold metallo-hydrolase [Planctomycetes bacterium]|nr:MBL fold metallo-hydrolase [Planctomycetota bacterium]